MSMKITLSSATLALCGALALSACQSSSKPAASGAVPSGSVISTSAGVSGTASSAPSAATGKSSAAPASNGGKSSSTAAPHDDDSYAFAHPCAVSQLAVSLTRMNDVPTRRLITVRNTAATSCGLSYHPLVDLGDSRSADHGNDVRPLIPGGLGGPPAYVLSAGKTAYAVLDLNPGGSGSGQATTLNEINVLVSDTMPNAETKNYPLGGGSVNKPKLGLYESGVADAVASMQGANTTQP